MSLTQGQLDTANALISEITNKFGELNEGLNDAFAILRIHEGIADGPETIALLTTAKAKMKTAADEMSVLLA